MADSAYEFGDGDYMICWILKILANAVGKTVVEMSIHLHYGKAARKFLEENK